MIKPKISWKTFYYVSTHAKHVEKSVWGDFFNGILAIL